MQSFSALNTRPGSARRFYQQIVNVKSLSLCGVVYMASDGATTLNDELNASELQIMRHKHDRVKASFILSCLWSPYLLSGLRIHCTIRLPRSGSFGSGYGSA